MVGFAFSSIYLMIMPATSFPVAVSIPSIPGEEFTSSTSGPRSDRTISTPATFKPIAFAASTAVLRSFGVNFTISEVPPRWRLDLNSPALAFRIIAATTLLPMTKQRISAPPDSLINSCTRKNTLRPENAAMTLSAAFTVCANTTPLPCVPSRSLITSGAPPTRLINAFVFLGEWAKPVIGIPMCFFESI